MPLDRRDPAHLWDMLAAAKRIQRFIQGKSMSEFLADEVLQSAIERQLEILGEAARRVSHEFQEEHQEIVWYKIIAQRNVLAHEYGEIEQDRIWEVATTHINDLIEKLEGIIPPPPED